MRHILTLKNDIDPVYSIIQRAGVVPMSIAGIAKEVTTITVSAWLFGDELTPLNVTGVAITACGTDVFTASLPRFIGVLTHQYRYRPIHVSQISQVHHLSSASRLAWQSNHCG